MQHSDGLFAYIEDQIDEQGLDFDCQRSGNVLTIEADDGTQIIVNRHTPNQELWIAAKSGGYHFAEQGGRWLATRDGREFFRRFIRSFVDGVRRNGSIEPFEG